MALRMDVLRVATVHWKFPNCTFDIRGPCDVPGNRIMVGISRLMGELLFTASQLQRNFTLQFIPAQAYGIMGMKDHFNSSVLGLLQQGKADISTFDLTLVGSRNKVLDYPGATFRFYNNIVYKDDTKHGPSLELSTVAPRRAATLVISLMFLLWILKSLFRRFPPTVKAYARFKPLKGIFAAVLLGYISSTVVLLFNSPAKHTKPFTRLSDLASQIKSGRYSLAVDAELTLKLYQDSSLATSEEAEILGEAFKANPPLLVGAEEAVKLVLSSTANKKYILITVRSVEALQNMACGLSFLQDIKKPQYSTIYMRPGLNEARKIEFTTNHRNVLWIHWMRLKRRHIKVRKCYMRSLKTGELPPVNLSQVEALFVVLGSFGIAGGAAVMILEGMGMLYNKKFGSEKIKKIISEAAKKKSCETERCRCRNAFLDHVLKYEGNMECETISKFISEQRALDGYSLFDLRVTKRDASSQT